MLDLYGRFRPLATKGLVSIKESLVTDFTHDPCSYDSYDEKAPQPGKESLIAVAGSLSLYIHPAFVALHGMLVQWVF